MLARRLLGETFGARLGTALMVAGGLLLTAALTWQLGLLPGSRVTVPEPVALARAGGVREVSLPAPAPTLDPSATPMPTPTAAPPPAPTVGLAAPITSAPTAAPAPTVAPRAVPFDAADRADRAAFADTVRPGYAVSLAIPAIKLVTEVRQAGVVRSSSGELEWETLPFVAAHYGDLTALVGAPGNAVISGHVVTLNEGNVFRFLYQLDLEDEVEVTTHHGQVRRYRVTQVRLVSPSEISVMAPTSDERLTLITCGGTFDPVKREFSDRLIVVAHPT